MAILFESQMLDTLLESNVYKQSCANRVDSERIRVILECVHGAKAALQSGHIDVLKVRKR
jgi:hypothetical protein